MVTVDADGYQEVRPRNGAPVTLSNFRAQRAGLSQRERKAGPRLQNMFARPYRIAKTHGGSSADISYRISTDGHIIEASPGKAASSSSSTSNPTPAVPVRRSKRSNK